MLYDSALGLPDQASATELLAAPVCVDRIVALAKPLQLPVPYRCGTRRPFEEQAAAFVAATVARWPALKVVAWTRVPYLSSGDARRTWYTLDNAVFVLRVEGEVER